MKAESKKAVSANENTEGTNLPAINGGQNNPPATISRLGVIIAQNLPKTELNGVVATTPEEMEEQIRIYSRGKILKQFGISEVNKMPVQAGSIHFNGVKTPLSLPKVKENTDGSWAETLPEYYNRIKSELEKWLKKAMPNGNVTMEMVAGI